MSPQPQPKMHSALTADEARRAIVAEVSKALDAALIAQGVEGRHITFVNAEWVGGVKVKAFLRKPTEARLTGSLGEVGEADVEVSASAPVEHRPQPPGQVRAALKGYEDEQRAVEEARAAEAAGAGEVQAAAEGVNDALADDSSRGGLLHPAAAGGVGGVDAPGGGEGLEAGAEVVGTLTPGEYTNYPVEPKSDGAPSIGVARSFEDTPEIKVGPSEPDACQFCAEQLPAKGLARFHHMRAHVKAGVAEEYEGEGGVKAWRAK